ncbi:hypothetical protein EZV62_006963 [Acer yangbiense]|uniref:Uncharacterized protein n=1 Tax=Acer yangbiense TaxID=1000413 RepID=A0A5C7I994_9ROSI|nr:hypothetical protein EZV62_006963 [Acer yangbiense]
MYSAAVSSQLRGDPPATKIYLRLNLKLDAKELLSLRSLVDSVMKSIESYPKVRCQKKATVLFVKMIVSCALQGIRETTYCLMASIKMSPFITMRGNAPTDARYVFAQHEAGHFLVGYLLDVLPKGLQGTKHRSSEAGEVRCSKSSLWVFEFLKEVICFLLLCFVQQLWNVFAKL